MSEVKVFKCVGYMEPRNRIGGERWVSVDDLDRVTAERDALQQDLNQRDEQIATLDLQREAHLRNSQVMERRVGVLEGLLRHARHHLYEHSMEYKHPGQPALIADIDAALKPAEGGKPSTCTWSHDGIGIWSGSCGTKWAFTEDGPTEDGMHFCHSCGNRLLVEDKGDE